MSFTLSPATIVRFELPIDAANKIKFRQNKYVMSTVSVNSLDESLMMLADNSVVVQPLSLWTDELRHNSHRIGTPL